MEVRLLAYGGGVLILMRRKIIGKLARIAWIGTEAQAADRAGILAGPYAFAFPVCHYRPEANFFVEHT